MKAILKIFAVFFGLLFVARIITVYVLYWKPFSSDGTSISAVDAVTDTAKNYVPQIAIMAGVVAISYKWIKRKFRF